MGLTVVITHNTMLSSSTRQAILKTDAIIDLGDAFITLCVGTVTSYNLTMDPLYHFSMVDMRLLARIIAHRCGLRGGVDILNKATRVGGVHRQTNARGWAYNMHRSVLEIEIRSGASRADIAVNHVRR